MPAARAGALLRAKEVSKMKRILTATDGSAGGREAVEQGLALARTTGAVATIVCVRKPPPSILGDTRYQCVLTETIARARYAVQQAEARAHELGVETEPQILEGDAATQIVELAGLRDVDLIVVGSRALGSIAGTLLGSVSQAVVHAADRPVLVVTERLGAQRAAA
jgi:nucleotide-binding universal stress UspA family protein